MSGFLAARVSGLAIASVLVLNNSPSAATEVEAPLAGPASSPSSLQPLSSGNASFQNSGDTGDSGMNDTASQAEEPASTGEIVVTARKRTEAYIDVPVVMTVISGENLKNSGVNDLDGISTLVPQLTIANQNGGIQGGTVVLRGISGPAGNPQGDQAVSFNIDGVQIAKASVRRMGTFDLAGVEVLKGPQALFFGKNSPGGIITIRTADPTPELSASATVGYEFNADQIRGEGFVSTPLGDDLGVRLAGFATRQRGDMREVTPDGAYLEPDYDRSPKSKEFGVRGTAVFDPSDSFMIRAKLSYGEYRDNGLSGSTQAVVCPAGFLRFFGGGGDTCEADGAIIATSLGPDIGDYAPIFRDGETYSRQKQLLAGLEINKDVADDLTFTSISGYYRNRFTNTGNFVPTFTAALPAAAQLEYDEFSQELRLDSDFDGSINFTAGVFFADTEQSSSTHVLVMAVEPEAAGVGLFNTLISNGLSRVPIQLTNNVVDSSGNTYSAFMQARFNPVEDIEISAGGRYSRETKSIDRVLSSGNRIGAALGGGAPVVLIDPSDPTQVVEPGVVKKTWTDFSPEITVSWKPNDSSNIFASYKEGFLSGGYNTSAVTWVDGVDTSYDPEEIKGFEVGYKAALFDRALNISLAAYHYKIAGLQVTNFVNGQSRLENAAGVKVKGFEFDFNYRTALPGLVLRGALAYNDGKYTSFPTAPCYAGQTEIQGCDVAASNQDLSGKELLNAPDWTLSGGIDYQVPVGDNLDMGFSLDAQHTSSYLGNINSNPDGRQPAYTLLNSALRLSDADERWELAVIGKNLTDKRYWSNSYDGQFSGGAPGSGIPADITASVSRGREIWLRATVNFN
ncbi:TonB-dependent receptor [Croceicoccus sediminis]|uniref:TonB-dependent receptor n=1 Tax=Croceicoccus sediminis TaxID=2571150 RepID=UPI001182798D|nr:TonB-dependent receptor [Croceicoccus sediminis]